MKPLLKWVGGKTQILNRVLEKFPRVIEDYYEPFLGGGSVLLGVLASDITVRGTCYASDVNPRLINFYKVVQANAAGLIERVRAIVSDYDAAGSREAFYYRTRDQFNALEHDGVEAAALFLFLNKTCFRGVYREGPRGFNVPFGHYKTVNVLDEEHLLTVSRAIQRVVFSCHGFERALESTKAGDFVYADPPYVPETATSFVGYVSGGFDLHNALFDRLKGLPCAFLMSNSNAPVVHTSFPEPVYTIAQLTARRAIHSRNPETRTLETLVTRSPEQT